MPWRAVSSAIRLCSSRSTGRAPAPRRRRRPRTASAGCAAPSPTGARRAARRRRSASRSGVRERLGVPHHPVDLRARLLVEPGERELPRRRRAPVGHHPARVAPVALEDVLEQVAVAARVLAVDLVVAGHDRARLRALDRDLERQQVGLAVGGGVDPRVQPVAVGLVAVEREVLDRRDHALALDAADRLRRRGRAESSGSSDRYSKLRPLRGSRARLIAAREQHVEAAAARLAPEHRARRAGERGVERRARARAGRQRRGRVALRGSPGW